MLEERPQHRQSRTGTTWTEEENEQVVALVRTGAELDAVADGVQRSSTSVVARLRRMLPLEHRSCPNDRVVLALRDHLRDPGYDGQGQMLLTPLGRSHESYLATHRELAGFRDLDEQVHRWSKAVGLAEERYPYEWAGGPW